jgi:hypothetical protein
MTNRYILAVHTCVVRRGSASRDTISLGNLNAPGRNRTCDPLLRRQVLYPLSYEGEDAA